MDTKYSERQENSEAPKKRAPNPLSDRMLETLRRIVECDLNSVSEIARSMYYKVRPKQIPGSNFVVSPYVLAKTMANRMVKHNLISIDRSKVKLTERGALVYMSLCFKEKNSCAGLYHE